MRRRCLSGVVMSVVSLFLALSILAGCAPKIIKPTSAVQVDKATERVVEKEKVVKQTVVVEKEIEKIVERPAATSAPQVAEGAPTPQPPRDMTFKDYGVNPFIDTEDDHLSTFGLDVDTASYTLARKYVTDGQLPPEDAVRVEEFVNYFDQGYHSPAKGQAFAIAIDASPFPFAETERYLLMRVGIQGYVVPEDERKPVVLTFIIDESGSMADGGRLELVKNALIEMVAQLRPSDSVGIVAYTDDARVVLKHTSARNKAAILRAIANLQPRNSTNAEAGLVLGYRKADAAFNPECINRVILCSDGVANVGQTGPGSILERIKDYASKGIVMTSVGVGMGNLNDVLLEQIADRGDGTYVYIDTPEEAHKVFVEDLTGTLQAIALDARLQVDFNAEAVSRYRLLGFENRDVADTEFRSDKVEATPIGAGHNVTALYEVKLQNEVSPEATLATVYLRWQDPDNKEFIEIKQAYNTSRVAKGFTEAAPRLQWDAVVAEYAEVLRGSPYAKRSSLASVLEEAERVGELLADDQDVQEFVDLVRRANELPSPES